MEKVCEKCKRIKKDVYFSEGNNIFICKWCYRKHFWKPKLIICKRCGREKKHQAFGLCPGCYNSTFHLDKVKLHNAKRLHKINPDLYKRVVSKCTVCDFDRIVELHHLDNNHLNSIEGNLIGLCPNHHKMIHSKRYQREMFVILKQKGFSVPKSTYKNEEYFNKLRT